MQDFLALKLFHGENCKKKKDIGLFFFKSCSTWPVLQFPLASVLISSGLCVVTPWWAGSHSLALTKAGTSLLHLSVLCESWLNWVGSAFIGSSREMKEPVALDYQRGFAWISGWNPSGWQATAGGQLRENQMVQCALLGAVGGPGQGCVCREKGMVLI